MFPKTTWDQLRSVTADNFIRALEKDGWNEDKKGKTAVRGFKKDGRRVAIHYHPGKTFGSKLLRGLLKDVGWNEDDFIRLKLVKKR